MSKPSAATSGVAASEVRIDRGSGAGLGKHQGCPFVPRRERSIELIDEGGNLIEGAKVVSCLIVETCIFRELMLLAMFDGLAPPALGLHFKHTVLGIKIATGSDLESGWPFGRCKSVGVEAWGIEVDRLIGKPAPVVCFEDTAVTGIEFEEGCSKLVLGEDVLSIFSCLKTSQTVERFETDCVKAVDPDTSW